MDLLHKKLESAFGKNWKEEESYYENAIEHIQIIAPIGEYVLYDCFRILLNFIEDEKIENPEFYFENDVFLNMCREEISFMRVIKISPQVKEGLLFNTYPFSCKSGLFKNHDETGIAVVGDENKGGYISFGIQR